MKSCFIPTGLLTITWKKFKIRALEFWELKYITVDVIVNTHHYFGFPKCLILKILSVN